MAIEAVALLGGNLALVGLAAAIGGWLLYGSLRRMTPAAYSQMEQTIADAMRQVNELREQQASDHVEMRRMRMELSRIDAEIQEWRAAYAALVREFLEATGRAPKAQPPADPTVAAPAPRPVTAREPARLLRLMVDAFSAEEIETLAFEMGLAGSMKGETADERAQSLIGAANRRKRLDELIALARQQRPEGGF